MTMTERERDWAATFNHMEQEFAQDPYPVYDHLRQHCPVAHSDNFGGMWVPTRYEDLVAIAHDTEHFSSRMVVISENMQPDQFVAAGGGGAPPITADPPIHTPYRRMLLPWFSPRRIDAWTPVTRDLANELIDDFIARGECDAAQEYAQHIPVRVIAKMLGVPTEDGPRFTHWIHDLLEAGPLDPTKSGPTFMEMIDYLRLHVEDHRATPRDDLISELLEAELDGKKLEDFQVIGTLLLLLIAGIDTTWSSIGAALWHLAQNPDDTARMVSEPELMTTAVEEFLRVFSPVTMARVVAADVEFEGCPMKAGDKMLLPFPSGNRDPEAFPDADKVILDRQQNRHLAFGVGIHRCLGSNLARMELRVALEEWLRRIPEFHLADAGAVRWSTGQVRGPRTLPVVFDRLA